MDSKPKIIQGRYLNNWAVEYPSGVCIQCKNYATALYYKRKYIKEQD